MSRGVWDDLCLEFKCQAVVELELETKSSSYFRGWDYTGAFVAKMMAFLFLLTTFGLTSTNFVLLTGVKDDSL